MLDIQSATICSISKQVFILFKDGIYFGPLPDRDGEVHGGYHGEAAQREGEQEEWSQQIAQGSFK